MVSEVYFINRRSTSYKTNQLEKLSKLLKKAGLDKIIRAGDLTAVKMHFGDKGNTTFLNPVYAGKVVEEIKKLGGKPFLTDTNTLYAGQRANSVDHLENALANGFSYATVKAPIIIADGLKSKNAVSVDIKGKHFSSVKIASDIYHADAMIVLSHFKGHEMAGFGGAIKNLAMGCATAVGKQQQHSTIKPQVGKECIGCRTCVKWCPAGAISMVDKKAVIDHELCLGCGECIVSCQKRFISTGWETDLDSFLERLVEYALGAVQSKAQKALYVNFVVNVTPECDCAGWSDAVLVEDVGILASYDPVALDHACYDLVNQQRGNLNSRLTSGFAPGEDKFKAVHPEIKAEIQWLYGEAVGLGSSSYKLIEL